MRVKHYLEYAEEIDVDVTLDDLKMHFDAADPETVNAAKALLNSAYCAIAAMPAKLIAEMSPEVRETVVKSFSKELERYR